MMSSTAEIATATEMAVAIHVRVVFFVRGNIAPIQFAMITMIGNFPIFSIS